jgi:NapH/MauN family ferredoxin-type protein
MPKIFSKLSLRFFVQLVIVVAVFSLAIIHQKLGVEKAAPIDAYCPFGAVESFFTLLFKGEFLKRIFTSSFILLGIFLVGTLFLGRIFCGFFCPLGALSEWLRALGRKLGIKKDLELPAGLDKYLRYVKYLVLVIVVYYSFYLGDLVFRNYDPYNALMHLGIEFEEKIIGYGVLAFVLIGALFSKNLWCRYFCPLGAFFGLIRKFSFMEIERDVKTCSSCGVCDNNCPANLKIATAKTVDEADCICCGKCIRNCPEKSLSFAIFGEKISKKTFTTLVVVLVILPLVIAPFTPFWKTKPESNIVNVKGEINTADIRGSNTLQYVIEVTKVPLAEFQAKLALPKDIDTSLKLKEIGLKYELKNKEGNTLETEDFRAVIDVYFFEQKTSATGDCPFDEKDCEFPGKCASYVDVNGDKVCDHSE